MQSRLTNGDTLDEMPKAQRQRNPQPLVEIEAEHGNRGAAMAAAYGTDAYTMKTIAAYFGVHYSTVSRGVRAAEEGP